MTLFRSFWSLLSGHGSLDDDPELPGRPTRPPARTDEAVACERLRSGMHALAAQAHGTEGLRLRRQIEQAGDLQSLWFLRSNLAAALSEAHGERFAMHHIETVSAPARSRLPRSLAQAPAAPRHAPPH